MCCAVLSRPSACNAGWRCSSHCQREKGRRPPQQPPPPPPVPTTSPLPARKRFNIPRSTNWWHQLSCAGSWALNINGASQPALRIARDGPLWPRAAARGSSTQKPSAGTPQTTTTPLTVSHGPGQGPSRVAASASPITPPIPLSPGSSFAIPCPAPSIPPVADTSAATPLHLLVQFSPSSGHPPSRRATDPGHVAHSHAAGPPHKKRPPPPGSQLHFWGLLNR